MQIMETAIPGCKLLKRGVFFDLRGTFIKVYHQEQFEKMKVPIDIVEQLVTFSKKGVLRGMHFQKPPTDHSKIVTCLYGTVVDVVVDLRVGSPTYGRHASMMLSAQSGDLFYIPSGLAHGYYALEDAIMLYNVSTVHSPEDEGGILWNSAHIQWPSIEPILSQRDQNLQPFDEFESPFLYDE